MPRHPGHRIAAALAAMLLTGLVTGCAGGHGTGEPGNSASTAASSPTGRSGPPGLAEMQKKVDDAESAAAAAESDAASDG